MIWESTGSFGHRFGTWGNQGILFFWFGVFSEPETIDFP